MVSKTNTKNNAEITNNTRVGLFWKAGADSYLADFDLEGKHDASLVILCARLLRSKMLILNLLDLATSETMS